MQSFNPKKLYNSIWLINVSGRGDYGEGTWQPIYVLKPNPYYDANSLTQSGYCGVPGWVDVCRLDLDKPSNELIHNSERVILDNLDDDHWRPMPALEALLYQEQVKYIKLKEKLKEMKRVSGNAVGYGNED